MTVVSQSSPQTPAPSRPIVFGEVLFDCFGEQRVLGGAPFNVAWNLKGLGIDPCFVSAVGQDTEGELVKDAMESWQLDQQGLQTHPTALTGIVNVTLANNEPTYDIRQGVAYDEIEPVLSAEMRQQCGLFYHGSLIFRSAHNQKTIRRLIQSLSCPRFLDINIRQPFFQSEWLESLLTDLDHLKLNIDELRWLCQSKDLTDQTNEISFCRHGASMLADRYQISQFWVTLGSRGAMWIGADGQWCHEPAAPVQQMVDTVGAGDAFAAVVIAGIVGGQEPLHSLKQGVRFAAKVCGIRGATSNHPEFYQMSEPDDFAGAQSGPTSNRPT